MTTTVTPGKTRRQRVADVMARILELLVAKCFVVDSSSQLYQLLKSEIPGCNRDLFDSAMYHLIAGKVIKRERRGARIENVSSDRPGFIVFL